MLHQIVAKIDKFKITYFGLVFQIYLLIFAKQTGITVEHSASNQGLTCA